MKATASPSNRIRPSSGSESEIVPIGTRFHQLKMSLRRRLASRYGHDMPLSLIRRAVDEAEQVALASGFPHLFFPELADEQVRRIATVLHEPVYPHHRETAAVFAA